MSSRARSTEALVLKRHNIGEADRVVTLLVRDQGKVACLAKGVRKLTSSRAASLEPGNVIKCQLITTKSMPLLTQATLVSDCSPIRGSLAKLRQLSQVLEMIEMLFVEEELDDALYQTIIQIRRQIVSTQPTPASITGQLEQLLVDLGYQHPSETKYQNLNEYVSALADKPLKSWSYLHVKR